MRIAQDYQFDRADQTMGTGHSVIKITYTRNLRKNSLKKIQK